MNQSDFGIPSHRNKYSRINSVDKMVVNFAAGPAKLPEEVSSFELVCKLFHGIFLRFSKKFKRKSSTIMVLD